MKTSEIIQAAATVLADSGDLTDHIADVLYIIGETQEPNGLQLVVHALSLAIDEAGHHVNDPSVGIGVDADREAIASAQYHLDELRRVLGLKALL